MKIARPPKIAGMIAVGAVCAISMAPFAAEAQTYDLAISLRNNSAFSVITPTKHDVPTRDTLGNWYLGQPAMSALIPNNLDIDGLSYMSPTDVYFSLDADTKLSGVSYKDNDIIHWDGSSFSLTWDGEANGLPTNANLDALDIISISPLEFSFSLDADAQLTIGGTPTDVADEDVIHYLDGSGFTAIDFDGSAHGVSSGEDLDGFSRLSSTQWIMSFDSAGQIPGAYVSGGLPLDFDDADLLEFNPVTGLFSATLWLDSNAMGLPPAVDIRDIEVKGSRLNPAATPTATATPSPTVTRTASSTSTRTATPSATRTSSPTATRTASSTATRTSSPTATRTATLTATRTGSSTASRTATRTATRTASSTTTRTATASRTSSPTATPTRTASPTPNAVRDWENYQ